MRSWIHLGDALLTLCGSQASNRKLACDIEAMRGRLQAMGMCVDHGQSLPTPCESLVPSVAHSPAKQLGGGSKRPDGRRPAAKAGASPAKTPRPAPVSAQQTPVATPRAEPKAVQREEGGGPQQPSLFAKMRSAGAVKAAERADGGVASNAGDVYRAVEASEGGLKEERKAMKEEARKRVEEELEQRRQADDEARKEKFRGAKEEAEAIRERLKELERRKADAAQHKAREAAQHRAHEEEQAMIMEEAVSLQPARSVRNVIALPCRVVDAYHYVAEREHVG